MGDMEEGVSRPGVKAPRAGKTPLPALAGGNIAGRGPGPGRTTGVPLPIGLGGLGAAFIPFLP